MTGVTGAVTSQVFFVSADWSKDLASARAGEDAFDSLLTAAAVLRCTIEDQPLCEPQWVDRVAEGSMLLAGPVDPMQRTRAEAPGLASPAERSDERKRCFRDEFGHWFRG